MSDILDMVVATLTDATNKANAVAEKVLAATTDKTKRVHEIRTEEPTDDPKIAEFRAWFEKANAKIEAEVKAIDEYIRTEKLGESLDEATLDALKEEYKSLKSQVTSAVSFAKTVPGFSDEALANVPDLKSLRGGTSGGTGSGGKRPRVERISYSDNAEGPWTEVEKDGKANFTLLASRLSSKDNKVSVKDLQAAAFESAGTDDLASLDGRVFTFAHTVNGKTVWVKVQPSVKGEKSEATDNEPETEASETEAATA